MQVQQKVDRLVAIWEERKVFGQSGTKPFKELVTAAEAPKAPGTHSQSHALRDDWYRMGSCPCRSLLCFLCKYGQS